MKIREYINRTIERIQDLDRYIEACTSDKNLKHILENTRKSNYRLYFVLTNEVYPYEVTKLQ